MASFTTSRDDDCFILSLPELTLAFSLDDGGLRVLRRAGGPNVLGHGVACPSIDICLGDRGWLAGHTFVRYLSHSIDQRDNAVELVIVIGIGQLMVYDRYRITGTLIARRVSVENASEDEAQLLGIRLSLPWARVGMLDTCRFEAPGNSVRPHVALSVAADQRRDVLPRRFFAPGLRDGQALELAPTHGPGLLAIHDSATDEVLLCWYYGTADTARPQVQGNGKALTLEHEIGIADWLRAEVGLTIGTQFIMLLREPWPAALSALQRTWLLCGLRTLDRPAAWVRDSAIYEVHPASFGGLPGLAAALPDLRALGIDTLCLMPVWDFANHAGRLWDENWETSGTPYAIRDFDLIDPTLGTAEDLRALVDTAHHNDMRVLIDLPLAGAAADGHLVDEHPEWFCYDTHGRLVHASQGNDIVAFDWSNPDLRQYILGWALAQARAYDLDGYRAIVPRTAIHNWGRARRGHAGASGLDVIELLGRLQRELKWIKGDAALLGVQSGPIYTAINDFALDDLSHHMFVHLALNRLAPGELGEWLEDHARVLPYDSVRVCYTENYRTHIANPLANGLRGSRISRMLLAGMVLCGFIPLIHAGQEQQEGQFIGQVLHARACNPALRHGRALYNALPCSSTQVFGILRQHESAQLIGMLNVSARKQTVVVSLPVDRLGLPDGDYELYDLFGQAVWEEQGRRAWRRDELLAARLTLEPFAAYCFAVRPAAVELPGESADRAAPATPPAPGATLEPEKLPAIVALDEQAVNGSNGRRQARRKRET
jgi:hypothetical protein